MSEEDYYNQYWNEITVPDNNYFKRWNLRRKKLLVSSLLMISENSKVMDAGCGTGMFSGFLYRRGYEVTAFDTSEVAMLKAKNDYSDSRIKFVKGSFAERLPFDDGEFSAIWCSEVLEHIFDVHNALKEFNRVLKQDGLLIATVPYHGRIKMVLISLFGFEGHFDPYLSHIRFFNKRSFSKCLSNAGFKMIRHRGIGRFYPLFMSLFVVAKKTGRPTLDRIRIEG